MNWLPSFPTASRGRKVNPKNVNDTCSKTPRRLLSLQYTILVLCGCSSSPTWRIRSCSAASTLPACARVMQWITG